MPIILGLPSIQLQCMRVIFPIDRRSLLNSNLSMRQPLIPARSIVLERCIPAGWARQPITSLPFAHSMQVSGCLNQFVWNCHVITVKSQVGCSLLSDALRRTLSSYLFTGLSLGAFNAPYIFQTIIQNEKSLLKRRNHYSARLHLLGTLPESSFSIKRNPKAWAAFQEK